MDFTIAAQRLARDQNKHRQGRRPVEMSAKAKRESELRKQQQTAMAIQRDYEKKQAEYLKHYFIQREQSLSVKYLGLLAATSIYGEGDKIALPPSVLQALTAADSYDTTSLASTPWTFRVGLCNPDYSFPASPLLQALTAQEDDEVLDDSDHDDDASFHAAFLDELDHKYLAYTHATVVEFTQEEGHVGLPEPIAVVLLEKARLKQQGSVDISTFRTIDPAAVAEDIETKHSMGTDMDNDDEKTPGHFAWGAFDLPNFPIEISLVKLPQGQGATLTPTLDAIQNGFYNLDDIKLVLEQSLVRTRATLTVGDTIQSWHRGRKYELKVSALRPPSFNAVVCLNTDLEVEFGVAHEESIEDLVDKRAGNSLPANANAGNNIRGRTLAEASQVVSAAVSAVTGEHINLPEEPPADADNVCLVQIRSDNNQGRRRFDVTSTMNDLFLFASTVTTETRFQLVTRFPRRVFTLADGAQTLQEAGITTKQELFMIERI
jgi:hypothetical protein